jgi:LmbE family N-acetylglucosaminyl deacetylase
MSTVLMLASFGLEIVECAGALLRALERGDRVHAAVLLSRPESRPQIVEAARQLGIEDVEFLGVEYGAVATDPASKRPLVSLIRRVRPDIAIFQDPEHAQHDLDPDRRLIALLYPEAFALASRDWQIEECGGFAPQPVPTFYYMAPERPNCVVEIGPVFERKRRALEALGYQMAFSAASIRSHVAAESLRQVVPDADDLDDRALGLALHRQFDLALALASGLASHTGAVLGEPYRREGPFVVDHLAR